MHLFIPNITMFDVHLFEKLFNETHFLYKQNPASKLIKTNLAALKVLAQEIKDREYKDYVMKQISNIGNQPFSSVLSAGHPRECATRESDKMKSHNIAHACSKTGFNAEKSTAEEYLQADLLRHSQALRKRAQTFDETLQRDEKVLKDVKESFVKNLEKAERSNFENKKEDFSIFKTLFYSILVFFVMYFLIRLK